MLMYDVCSFPDGLDVETWMSLYDKGVLLYDSVKGEKPFKFNSNDIALIDIRDMSSKDILTISEHINEVNRRYMEEKREERDIIMDNNRKLINYLKTINDEQIKTMDQETKI